MALVEEFNVEAWFSFTLRDGEHISDGTTLANVARLCATQPRVVAIGVNCVPLELVSPSLRALRKVTSIPLIAYPNSGECYDALTKTWTPGPAVGGADGKQPASIAEGAGIWQELGARLIGGCCRTTPQDIAGIGRYM
ncbi:homocysteine S-methyltransferase [Arthrobacter sp. Hiyo1]|nr:homocysteine S-methyltransferase [Arthrobacter sp. Hiyo1]